MIICARFKIDKVKVYHSVDDFKPVQKTVVTIGTFDGVHIGHQKIIKRIKELASQVNGETVIFTFYPHPRVVLHPDDNDLKLINTLEEKLELLEKAGIDNIIIQPFTKEFSRLSATEFVRDVLVNKLGTSILVIGYNHQFGRNREGNLEQLKELAPVYNFQVEEISRLDIESIAVSSTKIREALMEGDITSANSYLGSPFSITGEVIKGDQLGRTIGYPTANIRLKDPNKITPAAGVYAVEVIVGGVHKKGMLNIGNRPTFSGRDSRIEVHIFDFNEDIYGKELKIIFIERMRDEKKFEDIDSLKKQLNSDKEKALTLLEKKLI